MPVQHETAQNIQIHSQVTYSEAESRPEQGYFFFIYKITIKNNGSATAQLTSRYWLITDGTGRSEEVRGPGVVGLQPKIQPGQIFEYESACPLHTPYGSMRGHYQFQGENGPFQAEIPEFHLISPQALH